MGSLFMENLKDKLEKRGPSSLDDVELLCAVLEGRGKVSDLALTSERTLCLLKEHLWLYKRNFGDVLSRKVVTVGLVDQALVHPREVFSEAVKERAAKIIVAHNHPAGILSPSPEDIKITKNLLEASRILGICFLDHIIVTEEGYFSFREEGML